MQFPRTVIAVQLRKHENAIAQQSELHGIQMYREQLACKSLQEEMSRLADKHAHRMQCAREVALTNNSNTLDALLIFLRTFVIAS